MSTDAATKWLIDDAKRQGLTLSEYERKYGLILSYEGDMPLPSPAEQRIRRNEVSAGALTEDELRTTAHTEKRRALTRRQSAVLIPFPGPRRVGRVA